MAFAFGTQGPVAAFLVAFRFAHLLRRLFGEGPLQSAFIPHYESLRHQSKEEASHFFISMSLSLCMVLLGIVGVSIAGCAALLKWGNLSDGNAEIIQYTLYMLPSLVFICLYGLNAALLQCRHQYFVSGAAPIAFNFIWIAGVLLLWNKPIQEAMPWLCGCIILACFSQWAITLPATIHILKQEGLTTLKKKLLHPHIKEIIHPVFLGMTGVAASQVNNALDAVFARFADIEGPAYLWYAIRLQQLPLALFGIAISGALLPPLTRAIKANDMTAFRSFFDFGLRRSLALMIPMTAGIFICGQASIQVLYGRGDFSWESIQGTTECLFGYAAGLIPMTLVLIIAPAFYAQRNYKVPTRASVISMLVNIGLNTLFVAGFKWNAASIAWATSLSAWVNLVLLVWALDIPHLMTTELKKTCIAVTVASGIAALTVTISSIQLSLPIAMLCVQTVTFSSVFIAVAWIFRAQDVIRFFRSSV